MGFEGVYVPDRDKPGWRLEEELDAVEKMACEKGLAYFVRAAWHIVEPGNEYIHGWHIDMICRHLEAITAGEEIGGKPYNRLLINVPPGMMKSLLVAVFWPAWEWGPKNMPHMRYVCASHSQNLAIRDSLRMRRLVSSDWYQQHWGDRVVLTGDQNAKTKFENAATGFREAIASDSITGARGDRIIVDDPHSVEGASSDAMRNSTLEWFTEAVPTRMNNPRKSAIVVIMQRLHEEDVSGVILERKGYAGIYDNVCLPMEYDPRRHNVTKLGYEDVRTEEGELLFPERFPEEVVQELKSQMGPFAAAGQLQQSPAPRGGGLIKDEWWRLWEEDQYPELDYVVAAIDTAYTEKEENDYSAMTVWGVFAVDSNKAMAGSSINRYGHRINVERIYADGAPNVILLYAWQKRLQLPDLLKEVVKTARQYKVDRVLIEDKAAGISLSQEMRRVLSMEEFGLSFAKPKGLDKVSRLTSVQHLFAEGIVWAPDKEWAEMVIRQVASFPKGKHDDLCFVAGTMIATKRGLIPIETVTTGDWAMTPLGWRKVTAAGCTGIKPVITNLGMTGTDNHPVFTLNRLYQPLHRVMESDRLMGLSLCDLLRTARLRRLFLRASFTGEWAASESIISLNPEATPDDDPPGGFMSLSGNIIQGVLSRPVMKSIIETVTCLILSLKIWSAWNEARIAAWLKSTSTWTSKEPFLTEQEFSRLNGISLKRVGLGIGRSLRNLLSRLGRLAGSATSAPSVAFGFANGADLPLNSGTFSSDVATRNAHRQKSTSLQGNDGKRQPVYNLTIDGVHCYYANGILVHNCDTVAYAMRHLRESGILTRAPERIYEIEESKRYRGKVPGPLYPV